MAQVLHGCVTTTEAVRRAIQDSQASLRALARRYGVNPKTIAKWGKRSSVHDLRTGPTDPRSTVLSAADEAIVVAFRRPHAPAARRLPLRPAGNNPPYEYICSVWTSNPNRFRLDPIHQMPGLNT